MIGAGTERRDEGMHRRWDRMTLADIGRMSREEAIDLLQWNDPNGCYRDGDCGDDFAPMTLLEAHVALWNAVKESRPVAGGKRRAAPGQWKRPSRVQALLFTLERWTPATAKAWAREHGYRYGDVHVKGTHVRLRQHDPATFVTEQLRTIAFGEDTGIKAIIGAPRPGAGKRRAAPAAAYLVQVMAGHWVTKTTRPDLMSAVAEAQQHQAFGHMVRVKLGREVVWRPEPIRNNGKRRAAPATGGLTDRLRRLRRLAREAGR